MKIKLTIAGLVLFVVSFFLPAYHDIPGYGCAWIVLTDVWGNDSVAVDGTEAEKLLIKVYYSAFNLSNGLMLVLPVLLLTKFKNCAMPKWLIGIQMALVLHVLSWPVTHILNSLKEWSGIQVGYYAWLLSMLLLVGATVSSRKQEAPVQLQEI